jgi:hypothetical protein
METVGKSLENEEIRLGKKDVGRGHAYTSSSPEI